MPRESDDQFGMLARNAARAQAIWEAGIRRATHDPDEVLELHNFAVNAIPIAEDRGKQELVLVTANGRQVKARIAPENARALARQLEENAALEEAPESPGS